MEVLSEDEKKLPEISSKNRRWKSKLFNFLKGFIFVLCVACFIFQITQFLLHYFSHPTVLSVNIQKPRAFMEPTLTFCYRNMLRRSKYCEAYPNNCEQPEDLQSFCIMKPHYCNTNKNMTNFMMPKSEIYLNYSYIPLKDLDDFGDDQLRIIVSQPYRYVQPLFRSRWWYGRLNCDHFHSRVLSDNKPIMTNLSLGMEEETFFQHVKLYFQADEHFDPRDTPKVNVAIHSPFVFRSATVGGMEFYPGKAYKVNVWLEEEHLLPLPYKTACINYEDLWKKNNYTGPRSPYTCALECRNIKMKYCKKCTVTNEDEKYDTCRVSTVDRCSPKENIAYSEKVRQCIENECRADCRILKYKYKVQEYPAPHQMIDYLGRSMITVDFFVAEPQIYTLVHKPLYFDVEVFSYIGGFLGLWLGISIWSSAYNILHIPSAMKNKMGKTLHSAE